MVTRYFLSFFLIVVGLFGHISNGHAQPYATESQVKVAMRMIGHELLLLSGDSTSRVLPVQKVDDRYKIEFESEFEFVPGQLVELVNNIIAQTEIAPRYLVEVEECETKEVVYSYEIDLTNKSDIIPCGKRDQPLNCYTLFFTILEPKNTVAGLDENSPLFQGNNHFTNSTENEFDKNWLIIPIILLLGVILLVWMKKKKQKTRPEIINIGAYQFDKLNMQLSFKNKTTELSSKESDLLLLLYTSVNTTLERESILKEVWGDDGDYVGRTMDVFISKLRKKLADDSNLKIINIRGVGYKFVVNQ